MITRRDSNRCFALSGKGTAYVHHSIFIQNAIIAVFIPIIGILVGGTIAVIAILSEHREKQEMIKKGIHFATLDAQEIASAVAVKVRNKSLVLLLGPAR